jgi:hypothetical protein
MADSSRRSLPKLPRPSAEHRGLLDVRARIQLVRELRERASIERLFLPPRDWAERAGFEVALTLSLEADELADSRTVFYMWHPEERERGIRCYCGLTRTFFRDVRVQHNSYDVWLFAVALAVPVEARRNDVGRLSRCQPHCPVDVIAGVLAGRW